MIYIFIFLWMLSNNLCGESKLHFPAFPNFRKFKRGIIICFGKLQNLFKINVFPEESAFLKAMFASFFVNHITKIL